MMKNHLKSAFMAVLLTLCAGVSVFAQNRVTGTVKDANGEPVIAASVFVKGSTTIGAQTDVNGAFAIPNVPANATLVASCIGYSDQEVTLGRGQSTVNFVLNEDSEFLEEAVAIGYGTQKKSDITGSVASVDSEAMLRRAPMSIVQGLQGAAAGVVITQSGGDPAGGSSIRIRGVATMNGNTNPLWVVDGVQYGTHSNLGWLDPQDVTNIEILKDASATAIYGSRGANGVILVTTRKGKAGKTRVDFRSDFGVSTYATRMKMASLQDFLKAYRESLVTDGLGLESGFTAFNGQYDSQLNEIDWQDVMTQTSFRQQYNLSISGGSEAMRTNVSLGYMDNKGIIVNTWNKRLTMRLNTDFTITKWLKAGLAMNFSTSKNNGGGNMVTYARAVPTMDYVDGTTLYHVPVVYDDGTYGHYTFVSESEADKTGGRYQSNPYWDRYARAYGKDWNNDNGSVRTSAYVEVALAKWLTFRSNLNYDFSGSNSWSYSPAIITTAYDYWRYDGAGTPMPDRFSTSGSASTDVGVENYFTFNREFAKHHVTLMVGQSASKYTGSSNGSSTQYLTFPFLRGFYSTNSADYDGGSGGPSISTRFASYFARFNWAYDNRYSLTATVRRDGSSNFGKTHRWGTFPSFAAAWNLGNEKFIKELGIFDQFKLRAGWGTTGNANVSATASVPQLSASARTGYDLFSEDGTLTQLVGIAQTSEIDTGLHWETSVQTNFGVDLAFLKNALTFSVDYYIRDTRDLILTKAIRPSAGFSSITTNFGSIRNSGWEFALGYKKQVNRDFFFSVSATASTNKNEAVDIGTGTTSSGPTGSGWENKQVCYNGLPLGTYQGYRVDHIIKDQGEVDKLNAKAVEIYGPGSYYDTQHMAPGDFLFKDLNGDGHITTEDKDYIGNGFPKLTYGLNLSANYRNWDASMYMYGALGQQILSWAKCYLITLRNEGNGYFNLLEDAAKNSWTPSNPDAIYPRISRTDHSNNYRVSDYFVEKADYLKISNFQIGYTFNRDAFGGALRNLRIYGSIQNLFTFSPYNKYGDPEVSGGVTTMGYDSGRYPFPRSFMLGIQLGL